MENTDSVAGVADQEVESHEAKSSSERENLIALRKKTEFLEQQLLMAQQHNQMLQQASHQRKAPEPQEEEFDFSQIENLEFPDGKNMAKAFTALDKKLKKYDQKLSEKERKINVLETALQHKDFNEVVTPENIKKYIECDDDLIEAVKTASNPGKRIYNLIKKSADYQADQLAKKSPSQEQKRADEKENRPKTQGIGVRSEAVTAAAKLSNSQMTRQQKEAIWKETQAASRR